MRGPTNAIKGGARVVHEQIVLPCIYTTTPTKYISYRLSGEYVQQFCQIA